VRENEILLSPRLVKSYRGKYTLVAAFSDALRYFLRFDRVKCHALGGPVPWNDY